MSWRIVVISKRAKLDLKLNSLVVRSDEDIVKMNISEIHTLIIENTAISITGCLLSELTKQKVKIIFCDEKRNPQSELSPYYGSHDTSAKIRIQTKWDKRWCCEIWTEIVREKIRKQSELLKKINKDEYRLLDKYQEDIKFNDETNREGHAAKVYFNSLFGTSFTRSDDNAINAALNYGYGILLSAFNREVVACGYITQIGIFHSNTYNNFNLSSDFMETFRPLVDKLVYFMQPTALGKDEKMTLVNILNNDVVIGGKKQYVINAIKIYCMSLFEALNQGDISLIKFYKNEL